MNIIQQGIVLLISAYYERFNVTQTIQEVTTGLYIYFAAQVLFLILYQNISPASSSLI